MIDDHTQDPSKLSHLLIHSGGSPTKISMENKTITEIETLNRVMSS